MTRRIIQYTDARIAAAVASQRNASPDAHDELIADFVAIELTGGQADDQAEAAVSAQVLDYLARQKVEAGE